jgi:hypothetical protein
MLLPCAQLHLLHFSGSRPNTTLSVSARTKSFDLFGFNELSDEILEEQNQYLPMASGQTDPPYWEKSPIWYRIGWLFLWQRLKHKEGVGQHDQRQMPMQALPGKGGPHISAQSRTLWPSVGELRTGRIIGIMNPHDIGYPHQIFCVLYSLALGDYRITPNG